MEEYNTEKLKGLIRVEAIVEYQGVSQSNLTAGLDWTSHYTLSTMKEV